MQVNIQGVPSLGLWIINEFENLGKRVSAPDKQKLRVTCPTGKVEFKYFSSPGCLLVNLICETLHYCR